MFATGDYRGSAAEMHTRQTLGPPVDWTGIYSSIGTQTYTDHLRALEHFAGENPQSADAHFLLGFQYGATGSRDQAIADSSKYSSSTRTIRWPPRFTGDLQQRRRRTDQPAAAARPGDRGPGKRGTQY